MMIGSAMPPRTIYNYLRTQLVRWYAGLLAAFFGFVLIIDYMGSLDRYGALELTGTQLLTLAAVRLPSLAVELIPIALFLAALLVLSRNTRTSELVIVRAVGVSVWRFLRPFILAALFTGIIVTLIFDPLAKVLIKTSDAYFTERFGVTTAGQTVQNRGPQHWYAQTTAKAFVVLHVEKRTQTLNEFQGVDLILYSRDHVFQRLYQAQSMQLSRNSVVLQRVYDIDTSGQVVFHPELRLDLRLDLNSIVTNFLPASELSLYDIQQHMNQVRKAGLKTRSYETQWHRLLAVPLYYVGLVLLAACFALRMQRKGGTALVLAMGAITALLIYFGNNLMLAMGATGVLPPPLAIWGPVTLLLAVTGFWLLRSEDG